MTHRTLLVRLLMASAQLCVCLATTSAQSLLIDDPISGAQIRAARRPVTPWGSGLRSAPTAAAFADPIRAAQVLAAAERTFPNLSAELENAELLRKAAADPTMRGTLRGRLAEKDWMGRMAREGWKPVKNANAPQNDAFRFLNGRLEGAQIKVHADWHDYIRSMREDHRAERFVLPDDHFELVYSDLEARRVGALRGGLVDKAAAYARQQQRLTRHGRTFTELDVAIDSAAKHYTRLAAVVRAGGKAASFVGIAVALLDGSIAVYEVATGKAEVQQLVKKLGKVVVGGAAAWAMGDAAAAAAGATGAIPVAVAIVVATGTYLVIDWAIDTAAESLRVVHLSAEDVARMWPAGSRGVPLDRLYQKPRDNAAVLK